MFDPVFTIVFLVIVFVPIFAGAFWAARKFAPNCSALLVALAVTVGSFLGFFPVPAGIANSFPLAWDDSPSELRLATAFGCAVILAGFMGWIAWRASRRAKAS